MTTAICVICKDGGYNGTGTPCPACGGADRGWDEGWKAEAEQIKRDIQGRTLRIQADLGSLISQAARLQVYLTGGWTCTGLTGSVRMLKAIITRLELDQDYQRRDSRELGQVLGQLKGKGHDWVTAEYGPEDPVGTIDPSKVIPGHLDDDGNPRPCATVSCPRTLEPGDGPRCSVCADRG